VACGSHLGQPEAVFESIVTAEQLGEE